MISSKYRLLTLLVVLAVAVLAAGCGGDSQPSMTGQQAEQAAKRAVAQLGDEFEFESIADLDHDGVYEVSTRQHMTGNMGWMGGIVFRLEADSLVYVEASRATERGGGSLVFDSDQAILTYSAWRQTDPHCCPSMKVTEILSYQARTGFRRLSCDTTEAPAP